MIRKDRLDRARSGTRRRRREGKFQDLLHGHFGLQLGQLCFLVLFLRLDLGCFTFHYFNKSHYAVKAIASLLRRDLDLRAPFAAVGSLCTSSDTGTTPPFNIRSSICSCSMPSSSASRSCSSTGSPIGAEMMASPISWPSACCSRSSSLSDQSHTLPLVYSIL